MKIKLMGHTKLSKEFDDSLGLDAEATDGQVIALTAIRTCYSHKKPSDIVKTEGEKYFGNKGVEGKRLFKHIVFSGHTSTLEHVSFTFNVEGVSRALLAQLTRHRHISFSVQSQRYNKLSSDSRSGGFEYIIPHTVRSKSDNGEHDALNEFDEIMNDIQKSYNKLIELGIPQEDARAVLPNAATCNLVLTANLRTILDFYGKRKVGNGAQNEITLLAEELKNKVIEVEGWTAEFFEI